MPNSSALSTAITPGGAARWPGKGDKSCKRFAGPPGGAATAAWRGMLSAGNWQPSRPYAVQVVPQHLGPGRVAELRHRLGLDLPDPLPGNAVDLADLVEGLRLAIG